MSGDAPIGGYFGLSLGRAAQPWPWLDAAQGFQSARAALAALFLAHRATAVWVPHFVCGAVRDALAHAGTPVRGYALDAQRGVPSDLVLAPAEWLLCVDYFGLGGAACDAAIARHGGHRIVVDASQALLHAPRPGVATVYSPRKFCGVPDGGWLVNATEIASPSAADERASAERGRSLLSRSAGLVADGYAQFQQAEASLSDCAPAAMSTLTRSLFQAVDVAAMRERRIANYAHLAGLLPGLLVPELDGDAVPLCCPVASPQAPRLRKALAERGIFTPAYWPDADLPGDDANGLALRHGTLYLPCDQRYDIADMDRIAHTLRCLEETA